jgi:uncharacterized protein YbjT (DUF2867 family)
MNDIKLILVTGATGYVGGQLIPRLIEQGFKVRVFIRDRKKLKKFPWNSKVQIAVGDILKRDTLESALSGVDAAYYLIHSMTAGSDFAERDIAAARNFGHAAKSARIKRIIYLGGLGSENADLSEHLISRHKTGEALRKTGVCVTEFRAAIIVGMGSISFEMIRYLTERVPIMICPRWVRTKVQPIAIDDVISYLVESLKEPRSADRIIEIGGTDILTYGDLMKGYARVRGLSRLLLHVPVLTPRLSSYWVHWVTPISAAYARPLIEGLRSEVVVKDNSARDIFPGIEPMDYSHSVGRALLQLEPDFLITQAVTTEDTTRSFCRKEINSGMIIEIRQRMVRSKPSEVYKVFTELGGSNKWPCNLAWRLRAAIDRIIGGIGMRRGRPEDDNMKLGDTVDFFRVVKIESNKMIRLKAEMKLPGEGWLQFEAREAGNNLTTLVQTVFFAPKGLLGIVYWYLLYPVHKLIFTRMINKLAVKAEGT